MQLPIEISSDLKKYENWETDQELFHALKKNPTDLISFFLYASEDETWTEAHSSVMKDILNWITDANLNGNFPYEFLHQVIETIQRHISVLKTFIPLDLLLKSGQTDYLINSFLLSHQSHYFHRRIHNECSGLKNPQLKVDLSVEFLELIDEFILTGENKNLWKSKPQELWAILDALAPLGFFPIVEESEKILQRYIDRNLVIEMLIRAHKQSLLILQNACIEFINEMSTGIFLRMTQVEYLSLEFVNYQESAFEIFDKLKGIITHLAFHHEMAANPNFKKVINQCPKLIGLDLSESSFSDYLNDIPSSIKELQISGCQWINKSSLQSLSSACPHLMRLDISSNNHLNYAIWSELKRFQKISSLDISRCAQVGDRELKIILQIFPKLLELKMIDCQKVSAEGFFELSRLTPDLILLNISRTSISDPELINLMAKCNSLYALDISRCYAISDRGILEGCRNCPALRIIKLNNVNVSKHVIEELKRINPSLELMRI